MDYRRVVNQVVVGVALAVLASASHAGTIYVDADNCPGPGSGTPGDPYCSIQTAIDNAVDFDEIVVAPGMYFETIDFLGKAVWLRSTDGPGATIIDAGGLVEVSVVTCDSGEGSGTVLDGFTITGGTGDPSVPDDEGTAGGGMVNVDSSPTVTNCTFSGNSASFGGGMANWPGSDPTVISCTFSGNSALDGGGMYNTDGSSPIVTNCTFSENTADDDGGGMYNVETYYPHTYLPYVANCTFCGNDPNPVFGWTHLAGEIRMSDFCPVPVCPADTDGNGAVDVVDFLALLAAWGACP